MELITHWLIQLEPPRELKPRELYELGYMWASEDTLQVATGPENYDMD